MTNQKPIVKKLFVVESPLGNIFLRLKLVRKFAIIVHKRLKKGTIKFISGNKQPSEIITLVQRNIIYFI